MYSVFLKVYQSDFLFEVVYGHPNLHSLHPNVPLFITIIAYVIQPSVTVNGFNIFGPDARFQCWRTEDHRLKG